MEFKNREEWLRWRKSGIGASDTPIILGLSDFKTITQLYDDKVSEEINEETNYASDLGNEAEPKIRSLFELAQKKPYAPAVCRDSFLLASLDGRSEDKKEIIEIKLSGKEDYEYASKNRKPSPKYYAQIQHQFMVCKAEVCHHLTYPFGEFKKDRVVQIGNLVHLKVYPDKEYQQKIFEECTKFWNCVVNRRPPLPSDKDFYPLPGYARLADEWKKLNEKKDEIDGRIETIRKELIEAATKTGKSRLMCAGIKMSLQSRIGNVDYKKIPELQGVDLDKYRGKGSTFWKME